MNECVETFKIYVYTTEKPRWAQVAEKQNFFSVLYMFWNRVTLRKPANLGGKGSSPETHYGC